MPYINSQSYRIKGIIINILGFIPKLCKEKKSYWRKSTYNPKRIKLLGCLGISIHFRISLTYLFNFAL